MHTSTTRDIKQIPRGLAVTGRIKNWLACPTGRLPVSCTVFVVEDSMDETPDSIEASWIYTSYGLRYGAGVAVHLSKIRPKGASNQHGLVASGPTSFAQIYSMLCDILRRGGLYKKGAITLHLDYDHPDILEFILAPRTLLPWAKRCVNVDRDVLKSPHLNEILKGVAGGTLFLVKKQYDGQGERIYHNVCLEVLLKSRGTCLLSHVNLGLIKISELVDVFTQAMDWLCSLHAISGAVISSDDKCRYLSPAEDRQVGLGVLGLANLLAIEGIKYEEFVPALEFVTGLSARYRETLSPAALELANTLRQAYAAAAEVARSYNMERAFVIAPTASCSFEQYDRQGWTTAPEIAPPVSHQVERDSDVEELTRADYHPDVEIAIDVGFDLHFRLNAAWQALMDETGLAHAISTNWWSDVVVMDEELLERWLDSPMKSLYYAWRVRPNVQDKSTIVTPESLGYEGEAEAKAEALTPACSLEEDCTACAE